MLHLVTNPHTLTPIVPQSPTAVALSRPHKANGNPKSQGREIRFIVPILEENKKSQLCLLYLLL